MKPETPAGNPAGVFFGFASAIRFCVAASDPPGGRDRQAIKQSSIERFWYNPKLRLL
jgi:hypothetical protein